MDDVKDLMAQAEDLRGRARQAVAEARGKMVKAENATASARQDLKDAVRVALSLGLDREDLGKVAGVSPSTIGQWAAVPQEEPAKKPKVEPPNTQGTAAQMPPTAQTVN